VAGLAAHVIAPLRSPFTGGVALLFALAAHAHGWPFARGGSQAISDSLGSLLLSLGGEIETGRRIRSMSDVAPARAYLFDLMPRDLAAVAGEHLPAGYARRLARYRHGPGAFKVDYALAGPVPWRHDVCRRAGTVHVGGVLEDIDDALVAASRGRPPARPFLITAQPTLVDPAQAPPGQHVFWAYGHVPNGWSGDLTEAIERQLERFAPGFRDLVLARHVTGPVALEAHNPNNVGGDIAGGSARGLQAVMRPMLTAMPYPTPNPSFYLCSAATPPGAGVHGMCGYHAARAALQRTFGVSGPQDVASAPATVVP